MELIRRLEDLDRPDLARAGGKAANLGACIRAGLPVPPGFCLLVDAYRAFCAAAGLDDAIARALATVDPEDPVGAEAAASAIAAAFRDAAIPAGIAGAIRRAYASLGDGGPAVAVRSSATAEDLPDLSFAGQQDTYLNVVGEEAVLGAVRRCWASLWTARAIAYRARHGVDQAELALAVLVQTMVPAEAAGVMFTANPLSGKRCETVIEATLGLGEALVSGQVEPDNYLVEGGRLRAVRLGAKALAIHGRSGGGIEVRVSEAAAPNAAARQALPDAAILELAGLGARSAAWFGSPQDMEWAWASGRLLVLQSRPITSLFPLPEGLPAEPLGVFFSVGAVQGMLDPLTPLGRDLFALLAAGIAGHFGRRPDQRNQRSFAVAGGRLFINFTPVVGSRLGRNFIELGLPSIDPVSAAIFRVVLTDPRLPGPGRLTRRSVRGLAGFAGAVARTALATQLAPAAGRRRFIRQTMAILDDVRRHCAAAPDLATLVDELVAFTDRMTARLLPRLVGAVVSGQAPYQILQRRMAGVPGAADLAMEITRGLAHNVTSQMDLELWRVSRAIAADPAAGRCFREADAAGLAADCLAGRLPAVAQAALGAFLGRYGSRGVGEIDLGRPRWREDPTGLCQTLQSYLKIPATASPEAVFARGAEKAAQAATELVALCRSSGRLPGWLARFLVDRFRQLGGLRESPKFFIVRLFGEFRQALLAQGGHLMAEGRLDQPDDLVYLRLDELRSLATGEAGDWKPLVAARRTELAREARRPRVPRVFLSDGTAWYDAPAETGPGQPDDGCLRGSPVSAGTVEGLVRVITDPRGARLEPGEILVCPATDPAWTPLFLAAGGLVMEVGGLMTHGSVVAREYGIPAVVGVSQATSRLRTGQRLRLDGSTGRIQLLD